MIIVMASHTQEDLDRVCERVKEAGCIPHLIYGVQRTVVAVVGDERGKETLSQLESFPGVEEVKRILKPFKLASRETQHDDSIVRVGNVDVGSQLFCVFAGPCSVESREQIVESAVTVKESGAHVLRGGAYKPRTSPYAFQGLEVEGLKLMREASDQVGLPFVTEVMTPEQVPIVEQYADMLQIGARNIQNFGLLKAVGKAKKPVFLKRGMMSTIEEWLMSAEYIMAAGNRDVVLCERGIRTFERETRNTLDISAVPVLKKLTHLPVIIDPSHATGHWDLVTPMAKAAVACGADGLMVEVHPHPELAVSDGAQSLKPRKFKTLMDEIGPIAAAVGRRLR